MAESRVVSMCAVLALGLAGCSRPVAPPPLSEENVLAKVGDEFITAEQFQKAMVRRRVIDDPVAKRSLLDELIRHRALVQEGRRRGYDRDPEVVAAFESLIVGKVRQANAEAQRQKAVVTPKEVEEAYKTNIAAFTVPSRIRVAMIFVEAPKTLTEAARGERRNAIESAREQALALEPSTAGFGEIAAKFSYDQASRYRGGDIGYLVEGTPDESLDPEVVNAAFALAEPGQVSEIVTSPRGFFLLRLIERQPGVVRPLAQVEKQIRQRLMREKQQQLEKETADTEIAAAGVKINEERLANVKAPAAEVGHSDAEPVPPPLPAN